ncbi:MAG TPA: hypothetical protein VMM14_07195 [Acidimicrobiia bacterium]|nr:hypothetical protein [Acidimicrobiia bacterium]
MSRLTWVESDHGWRAGPYELELVAPQLWVCTRRRRGGDVVVEATSGSVSALKTRIERNEWRRTDLRRSLGYLAVFVLTIAVLMVAAILGSTWTPALVVLCSCLGLFSALKAVDCVVSRSWESLRLDYQ